MIKISKQERLILERDYNLRMHDDIHPTYTKNRHYYLTEKPKNMKLINKIRNK